MQFRQGLLALTVCQPAFDTGAIFPFFGFGGAGSSPELVTAAAETIRLRFRCGLPLGLTTISPSPSPFSTSSSDSSSDPFASGDFPNLNITLFLFTIPAECNNSNDFPEVVGLGSGIGVEGFSETLSFDIDFRCGSEDGMIVSGGSGEERGELWVD